jgi:hypothetical protein
MKAVLQPMRGFWGLFWRSIVFLPMGIIFLLLWGTTWVAVFVLPLVVISLLLYGDWLYALAAVAAWIAFLFLSRWKRLRIDRKDILNEGENI